MWYSQSTVFQRWNVVFPKKGALDGDDTFTATQVSHKPKQQLAYVPHQKRVEDNLHLRDKDLNGCDIAKAQYSNDETLFSLGKR